MSTNLNLMCVCMHRCCCCLCVLYCCYFCFEIQLDSVCASNDHWMFMYEYMCVCVCKHDYYITIFDSFTMNAATNHDTELNCKQRISQNETEFFGCRMLLKIRCCVWMNGNGAEPSKKRDRQQKRKGTSYYTHTHIYSQ